MIFQSFICIHILTAWPLCINSSISNSTGAKNENPKIWLNKGLQDIWFQHKFLIHRIFLLSFMIFQSLYFSENVKTVYVQFAGKWPLPTVWPCSGIKWPWKLKIKIYLKTRLSANNYRLQVCPITGYILP
jgi:hypothetical protein